MNLGRGIRAFHLVREVDKTISDFVLENEAKIRKGDPEEFRGLFCELFWKVLGEAVEFRQQNARR